MNLSYRLFRQNKDVAVVYGDTLNYENKPLNQNH